MAEAVYNVWQSHPSQRALAFVNSQAAIFGEMNSPPGSFYSRRTPPDADTFTDSAGVFHPVDGVYDAGYQTMVTSAALRIMPFAEGSENSQFYMRLWAWYSCGGRNQPNSDLLWVPVLLAELYCVSGNLPGPPVSSGPSPSIIGETERLCDTIVPTRGQASVFANGDDMVAMAFVPLMGCQKFQFDFAHGAVPGLHVGMNALWARA